MIEKILAFAFFASVLIREAVGIAFDDLIVIFGPALAAVYLLANWWLNKPNFFMASSFEFVREQIKLILLAFNLEFPFRRPNQCSGNNSYSSTGGSTVNRVR